MTAQKKTTVKNPPVASPIDISPYVSNTDKNVYAISGLPEEFIATLFAWVSRSPKSFREHLKTALQDADNIATVNAFKELDDKAKAFHEKWTVGYGHSSVAEHASVHVGIEDVSRLASAELELSNTFLSITEYSQRYQKPERGKWHNPFKKGTPQHEEVEAFNNKAFDAFEQLIESIYTHLKYNFVHSEAYESIKEDTKKVDRELNALMKLAFEDARYALPLSMHTQLGITTNGRALRDSLANLSNSRFEESVALADSIRTEATKVLPVLLKHSTPSKYMEHLKHTSKQMFGNKQEQEMSNSPVVLSSVESEWDMMRHIVAMFILTEQNISYWAAAAIATNYTDEQLKEAILKITANMAHFDMAPEQFKMVNYRVRLTISEANWHQLLRHNRKTNFVYSPSSSNNGITIPPRMHDAGCQDILKGIAELSQELYNKLTQEGYVYEAQYVVLNAHRRQVYMEFNLWEAYHLINLRTSEEAQWDIRDTFTTLHELLLAVHPTLFKNAKRRNV